jgi:hypothetical protein
MELAKLLRKKYKEFVFEDFSFKKIKEGLLLEFKYSLDPYKKFKSTIFIKKKLNKKIEENVLNNLLLHIGLVEMLNYWKLTCSPLIKIEAGSLNKEQIDFWKKIILKGMGQYFFENKINFREKNFLRIVTKKEKINNRILGSVSQNSKKCLVAVGGGKDSVLVIEILKKRKKDLSAFILNENEFQKKIIKIAKIKEKIKVERRLDKKLFSLQKKGFLKGHVPFSAFLSFLSIFLSYLFDFKEIAFGWEKSSSEPNLIYRGIEINHQWSKSLEFEKMLKDYTKKYLLKNISIFSPLRNLSEIEIAKNFSKLKKYHFHFLSCNLGTKMKKKRWCNRCAKCLFTFLVLFPFFETKKIIKIFGKNLLENKKLEELFLRLTGEKLFKPFECVGTPEETKTAIKLALEKIKNNKEKIPLLLKKYADRKIEK